MYFDVTSKAEAFYEFQKDLDEKIYAIDENAFVDGIINFEKNILQVLQKFYGF